MPEFTRKTLTLPEGNVSYLDWPAEARFLHFSHATGFNGETYRGLLAPLHGEAHIAAADFRGHGFTTLPHAPGPQASWFTFGHDLPHILDGIQKGPVILAGHSMGAITSMMMAVAHPERVRGLVLAEPVLIPRFMRQTMRLRQIFGGKASGNVNLSLLAAKRRSVFPSFEAALAGYRGRGAFKTWPDETIADYLRGGLLPTGNGTEVRLACDPKWESSIFQHGPAGIARIAKRVHCPLTVLYGSDGTTSESEVQRVARLHGNARIIKVPGTTHFLPMERPDIVQDEIRRMLKQAA